ncbi:MAG: M23 family metallopeptidase [Bacteroidetes bacterium]|nr:M23 family metallopeptidase [Bacteroidota bacterium]
MSPETKKKKNSFLKKLKNKYRLVVMNDDTFEEKLSLRLSRLNVFIAIGIVIIVLIFTTTYIIAFTPLREYIPGYGSNESNRNVRELMLKADSMQEDLENKELYLYNIKNIIEGKDVVEKLPEKPESTSTKYNNLSFTKSKEDSMLRLEMEKQEQFNIAVDDNSEGATNNYISNFFFFTPLKGLVTNNFNPAEEHLGVDIVAAKNEAIKATLDGTVVFAGWTLKTGYTIVIQHANNLISVYKHNSVLLKNEGTFVKAGEVIAIIGESGELSTGQHLHFELWYDGKPVNPRDYMVF